MNLISLDSPIMVNGNYFVTVALILSFQLIHWYFIMPLREQNYRKTGRM
jgi:hypothetical protein